MNLIKQQEEEIAANQQLRESLEDTADDLEIRMQDVVQEIEDRLRNLEERGGESRD